MVDQYVGHVIVGDICVDIIIRDYGDEEEKLAYSFDLYVAGEDTGYGYKDLEDGSVLPYDYAEGDDMWVSDLPEDFATFKKQAEELLTWYIAFNDTEYKAKSPDSLVINYSLVEKASKPTRTDW